MYDRHFNSDRYSTFTKFIRLFFIIGIRKIYFFNIIIIDELNFCNYDFKIVILNTKTIYEIYCCKVNKEIIREINAKREKERELGR